MPIRFDCKNSCIGQIEIDLGERNTFNIAEINELIKIFKRHLEKELDLKAILIKSSNKDFFATGPRIRDIAGLDKDGARYYITILNTMVRHIVESPVPVICVINGFVSGIGLDIVSSCDFRLAAKTAVFADISSKYGILSSSYTALRLAFLIGAQKAQEMILSSKNYSAEDMYRFNYLTDLFGKDGIDKGTGDFLNTFKELSVDSLRLKKKFFVDLWNNYIKNNQFSVGEAFSELLTNGKDWKISVENFNDHTL